MCLPLEDQSRISAGDTLILSGFRLSQFRFPQDLRLFILIALYPPGAVTLEPTGRTQACQGRVMRRAMEPSDPRANIAARCDKMPLRGDSAR
jgi:hypothetical protein